jgi:hypothetical protein
MKTKVSPALKRPLEIKRGNVTVKIYAGKNHVNDTASPQFTLTYYDGAQRTKKRFARLSEAKCEAELTATKLASGENEVLRLTSTDRAIYMQPRRGRPSIPRKYRPTERGNSFCGGGQGHGTLNECSASGVRPNPSRSLAWSV